MKTELCCLHTSGLHVSVKLANVAQLRNCSFVALLQSQHTYQMQSHIASSPPFSPTLAWSSASATYALVGECQWLIKQFSSEAVDVVDGMTRRQGYASCSRIFPGLRVSDIMDLVRVHGYGVPALTPLKTSSRAQGQALMEKVRAKVAGKRSADEVCHSYHCVPTTQPLTIFLVANVLQLRSYISDIPTDGCRPQRCYFSPKPSLQ